MFKIFMFFLLKGLVKPQIHMCMYVGAYVYVCVYVWVFLLSKGILIQILYF